MVQGNSFRMIQKYLMKKNIVKRQTRSLELKKTARPIFFA